MRNIFESSRTIFVTILILSIFQVSCGDKDKKPIKSNSITNANKLPSPNLGPDMEKALSMALNPTNDTIVKINCPNDATEHLNIQSTHSFSCGAVRVPEFHENSTNKFLSVGYMLISKQNGSKPLLVIEQGGPGGSSIALARYYISLYPKLIDSFDILAIEQRGTKWSMPKATCNDINEAIIQSPNQNLSDTKTDQLLNQCLKSFADQLSLHSLSSYQISQDIAFATQEFGYKKFSYLGVSYGTVIGQYLLKYNPDQLDKTVLDSPVVFGQNWVSQAIPKLGQLFKKNFNSFLTEPIDGAYWGVSYAETVDFIKKLVLLLEANPVELNVSINDVKRIKVKFDGKKFFNLLMTYTTSQYNKINMYNLLLYTGGVATSGKNEYKKPLTKMVSSAISIDDEDTSILWQSIYCGEEFYNGNEIPMSSFDFINEFLPTTVQEELKDESTSEICNLKLPHNNSPLVLKSNVSTDKSVLVLGGELDHVTLPENVQAMSSEFTNSHKVVFKGVGHGVFTEDKCISKSVYNYLTSTDGSFTNLCD